MKPNPNTLLIILAYLLLIGGGIVMLKTSKSDLGIVLFLAGVLLYLIVRIAMRRKNKVKKQ
ncbi:MAG TPA: hypothetical protein VK084_03120 [Chitinophagaceae bacterium]|nr:hypothetical protein [Chitinophagaceae bacterium]